MAAALQVLALQHQIAAVYAPYVPAQARTLYVRFEEHAPGEPGHIAKVCYTDSSGTMTCPQDFATADAMDRAASLSDDLDTKMAQLTPEAASGPKRWVVYLLTIDVEKGHYHFAFEYENPKRWQLTQNGPIVPTD